MKNHSDLTLARMSKGLVAGALFGTCVRIIYGVLVGYLRDGLEFFNLTFLGQGVVVAFWVFIVLLIVQFIFGVPVWLLLHWFQKTRLYHAVLSGFAVPFAVLLTTQTRFFTGRTGGNLSSYSNGRQNWVDGVMTIEGWQTAFYSSFFVGIVGAAMGAVIWFVAYGRPGHGTD